MVSRSTKTMKTDEGRKFIKKFRFDLCITVSDYVEFDAKTRNPVEKEEEKEEVKKKKEQEK